MDFVFENFESLSFENESCDVEIDYGIDKNVEIGNHLKEVIGRIDLMIFGKSNRQLSLFSSLGSSAIE